MTPDKKLEWFRSRGWSEEDIQRVKNLAVNRWEESYKQYSFSPPVAAPSTSTSSSETPPTRPVS